MLLYDYLANSEVRAMLEGYLRKALSDSEEVYKFAKDVIYPNYKKLGECYEPVTLDDKLIAEYEGDKTGE